MKRGRAESREITFALYGQNLDDTDDTQDAEFLDPQAISPDVQLLIAETRIGCTSGMLLCLDREQRLIFILGGIFGVSDVVGAELLELSRDNRDHPFQNSPDFVAGLRELMNRPEFRSTLELD